MKIVLPILLLLLFSGCSATWNGIKQDTSDALQWTKDRIDGR